MSLRRRSAPVLACAMLAGLLGGCIGGSSEADNPELVVGFMKNGEPIAFKGYGQVFAHGENPEFHVPPPLDEDDEKPEFDPRVFLGNYPTNLFPMESKGPEAIDGNFLARAAGYRVSIPAFPAEVEDKDFYSRLSAVPDPEGRNTLDPARPFNIVFRHEDGSTGFVQGIAIDTNEKKYRGPDGKLLNILWVDLHPTHKFTGVVDTNGLSDAPLVLFSPGSPYVARMHGNRFLIEKLPFAVLPMRFVTATGRVLAVREPLDATKRSGESKFLDTLAPLLAGERLDSLVLPDPIPMLDPPIASPAGPQKFTDSLIVTLSAGINANIHYTTDGEPPGLHSKIYAGPLIIRTGVLLKAVAYRRGSNHSEVSTNSYTLVPTMPMASPTSQAFRDTLEVTLSTNAKNANILYTTDGSNPHAGSPKYSSPILLDRTTILKAVTSVPGMELSQILDERYILVSDTLSPP